MMDEAFGASGIPTSGKIKSEAPDKLSSQASAPQELTFKGCDVIFTVNNKENHKQKRSSRRKNSRRRQLIRIRRKSSMNKQCTSTDQSSAVTGPDLTSVASTSQHVQTGNEAQSAIPILTAPLFIPLESSVTLGQGNLGGKQQLKGARKRMKPERYTSAKRARRITQFTEMVRAHQHMPMSSSGTLAEVKESLYVCESKLQSCTEAKLEPDPDVEILAEYLPSIKSKEETLPGKNFVSDHADNSANKQIIDSLTRLKKCTLPTKSGLRPIIIDGSNVALAHGRNKIFSWRGISICINYFTSLGHEDIKVFVPAHRLDCISEEDHKLIENMERKGWLVQTPSRYVGERLIVPYDDRFIVEYATKVGGIIVSRDQYRDVMMENRIWQETIENRLLQFTFAGDTIMFPLDPLGFNGPHLSEFLRFL